MREDTKLIDWSLLFLVFLRLLFLLHVLLNFGSLGCSLLPPLSPHFLLNLSERFPLPHWNPQDYWQWNLGMNTENTSHSCIVTHLWCNSNVFGTLDVSILIHHTVIQAESNCPKLILWQDNEHKNTAGVIKKTVFSDKKNMESCSRLLWPPQKQKTD